MIDRLDLIEEEAKLATQIIEGNNFNLKKKNVYEKYPDEAQNLAKSRRYFSPLFEAVKCQLCH